MTRLKFANLVRRYTKQTITSLADADLLLLANAEKDNMTELITGRDMKGNYFILPSLDNLIAGQREYAQPDDVLDQIFSVEFAFSNQVDQFDQLYYVKALPSDFEQWQVSRTEANIQAHYGNSPGMLGYTIQRRALYLLSGDISTATLTDVNGVVGSSEIVNGIRLRYRSYPSDFLDMTDDTIDMSVDPTPTTFGFPRQFHELLARRCGIVWKAQHPGAVPESMLETMYPTDLEEKLQAMNEPDLGGETLGTLPIQDNHNSLGYDL